MIADDVYVRRNWRDYRADLGTADRATLLKALCHATGYVPQEQHVAGHLAAAPPGETMHKLAIGGIGAGKTHWAMAEMFASVLANPGCRFLVAAPTYDQAMHVLQPHWQRLCADAQSRGFPVQKRFLTSLQLSELHCGGKVFFRTYSKIGHLLGFEFASVLTDEIDTHPGARQVWDTLHGRVRQPGAAWRQIFASTTPAGLQGVVEAFHQARQDPTARQSWYWYRALGLHNPYLPAGYFESLRASYSTRRWRQEVLAEILRPESAVLPEYDAARHAVPWRLDPALPYDIWVDWGHSTPHVLVVQFTSFGVVVADELCDDVGMEHVRSWIMDVVERMGREPEMLVGDRAIKSEMAWASYAMRTTRVVRMSSRAEQSVSQGIETVRSLLDPVIGEPRLYLAEHLTRTPPKRGIARCLRGYRYRMRADGTMSSDPYKDGHDHGVDALRMGCVARFGLQSEVKVISRRY